MIIDTHCHLDFKDFDSDRELVIERAKKAGVCRIVNVGSSLEGSRRAVELAKSHEMIYASVGIHPHDASTVTDQAIDEIRRLAKEPKVVAIGEVGLDYYRNLSPKDVQIAAFKKFIQLSQELKLPLIIHSRDAAADTIKLLNDYSLQAPGSKLNGVMHCFSGDKDFLKACLDLGLYISITCNITFKKADALREAVKMIPVERLLIETDAPYLAPQDLRGQRNESANLLYLINALTTLLPDSREDIIRITTHNANTLFSLGFEESNAMIAYPIRDSLYLNITNRCTNTCGFCVRAQTNFVKGHKLRLESEPSVKEILSAIGDAGNYREIVFCGYGEPTMRIDVVKTVSAELKRRNIKVRMVTNGHGDIINGRAIAKELTGLVDKVSVSLNTDDADKYMKICDPEFGVATFGRIIEFIKDCVKNKIEVEVTCLDLPDVDIKKCERLAKEMGGEFRLRRLGVVG